MVVKRHVVVVAAVAALVAGCTGGDDDTPDPDAATDEADGEPSDPETDVDAADPDAAVNDGYGGERPDDDERRTVAAGEDIPITLSLVASDEGGRQTAIFGGYRGTVTIGDQAPQTCALGGPADGGAMEPGSTYEVALNCGEDVTLEPGQNPVVLEEGDRAIGSGLVRS